jgi:hypothetical protein
MRTDIIELAVAIELECAGLYEVFAKRSAGNPELVYFWKLYAEAERYHGATIRIHQAAFAGDVDAAQLDAGPEEMHALLAYIRDARASAEREAPSVADAIRIARRIEESSAELHGRTQLFKLNPHTAELFEQMAQEDAAHREVLLTAERKFGGEASP